MFKKKRAGKSAPKFDDKKSLHQALSDFGISAEAAQHLASLGRTSLHLRPIDNEAGPKKQFSKIGGAPDLPDGTNWPVRPSLPPVNIDAPKNFFGKLLGRVFYSRPSEDEISYRQNPQPYNFIAQASFEEMATVKTDDALLLPESGALYLFYDDLIQGWGFNPEDAVGFKVIYVPDIGSLRQAKRPTFHQKVTEYTELYVEPQLRFEHSPPQGLHFEKAPVSEADRDAYIHFAESVEDERPIGWPEKPAHKVRGWSNNIQDPMEEECALVTAGIYCGRPEGYNSPEAKQIMDAPNDWVQLLQIDSDDKTGMMWGDAVMLYLWIKKSDLENRNFENTWLILQCS